jgi:hypothetical protein
MNDHKTTTHKIMLLSLFLITLLQMNGQSFQEPQWQMPLYFEDGSGASDTIWFGYDPTAGWYGETIDPQFNEDWKWIDTTQFHVYLYEKLWIYPEYPIHCDSVRKRDISSFPLPQTHIGFCKGIFPLTVRWDSADLNKKTIPFPDISPRPRGRIDMNFSSVFDMEPSCMGYFDVGPLLILTNYYLDCSHPCIIYDSLYIYGEWANGYDIGEIITPSMFAILEPHNASCNWAGSINEQYSDIKIYPNPVNDYLIIENTKSYNLLISISDLYGNIMYNDSCFDELIDINTQHYKPGIYIISIKSQSLYFTRKFIKL